MNPVLTVLIVILETLFAVGMIGSAAVILLTMFEDVEVMFEQDEAVGAASQIDHGVPER